jgi:penicillin amidase
VATFYHTPDEGDASHAVATMIFNAWFGRFVGGVISDEGFPSVWQPTGSTGQMRLLTRMMNGRGADNPESMASWNVETGESVYFDKLGTEEVETSDEVAIETLVAALEFLRSPSNGEGGGGFGSSDMAQWLWGLRHVVHFDSVLSEFLGDDPTFSFLTDQFSITTDVLPLESNLSVDDPRSELLHFPRPGDSFVVDAANPGFSGTSFGYGSGPVFRMVIALSEDSVQGVNVIPGGQSALTDSENFSDQAELWLANETTPIWFTVDEVIENALGRETFTPVNAEEK